MQVETYEIDELADATAEEIAEASEIAERLGLSNQAEAYARLGTTTDRRTMFREMSHEEAIIFATVFSERTPLESFQEPIPPRALRAIELAKQLRREAGSDAPFFETITILHPKRISDDPLAVGFHCPNPAHSWNKRPYMIARWGSALDEMPALKAKCLEICRSTVSKLESQTARIRSVVESGNLLALASGGNLAPWAPTLYPDGLS